MADTKVKEHDVFLDPDPYVFDVFISKSGNLELTKLGCFSQIEYIQTEEAFAEWKLCRGCVRADFFESFVKTPLFDITVKSTDGTFTEYFLSNVRSHFELHTCYVEGVYVVGYWAGTCQKINVTNNVIYALN